MKKGGKIISWRNFANNILDLIYPRRCPVCDKIVTEGLIHPSCEEQLTAAEEPVCFSCGKPLLSEETELCRDCMEHPKHFRKGYAAFLYNDRTRPSMMAYKYANRREYTDFYVSRLLKKYGLVWIREEFDGIVPVPVHRKRRRKRGYNQAELLATAIGKALQVPVYDRLICRTVNTIPLKQLNNVERLKHLSCAFQPGYSFMAEHSQECRALKKILLVDDIYTTGATMEACTGVLLAIGIEEVHIACVCIGQGYA